MLGNDTQMRVLGCVLHNKSHNVTLRKQEMKRFVPLKAMQKHLASIHFIHYGLLSVRATD